VAPPCSNPRAGGTKLTLTAEVEELVAEIGFWGRMRGVKVDPVVKHPDMEEKLTELLDSLGSAHRQPFVARGLGPAPAAPPGKWRCTTLHAGLRLPFRPISPLRLKGGDGRGFSTRPAGPHGVVAQQPHDGATQIGRRVDRRELPVEPVRLETRRCPSSTAAPDRLASAPNSVRNSATPGSCFAHAGPASAARARGCRCRTSPSTR